MDGTALHWIAWPHGQGTPGASGDALFSSACWALQFSPRVAVLEEAVLMETSSVQRLWGGRYALIEAVRRQWQMHADAASVDGQALVLAQGATAWLALARLRLASRFAAPLLEMAADALPLWTLSALQPHMPVLLRLGCRTWGDVRALPRPGLARRLGAGTMKVLDQAYGLLPEAHDWLAWPERFALRHDLGYPAHDAAAVLQAARPLLRSLQLWLQARHHGVLALQLRWHHDLRRVDGEALPSWEALEIRTAQPTQAMPHLERLLRERITRLGWRAPVDMLELQALETTAFAAEALSCLPPTMPEEQEGAGSASLQWHEWVERIGARWGEDCVQVPRPCADHRPEAMQQWVNAGMVRQERGAAPATGCADPWQALWPPWLLPSPRPLALEGSRPCWHGPLQLRARPYRLEAGWWDEEGTAAVRDYFVGYNEAVGHVWIYRERTRLPAHEVEAGGIHGPSVAWYGQGVYG
jgi:protein ImuB